MTGLKFTLFADIEPNPSKSWLVRGMLGDGELSCMFGKPGSGKSALAIDLAAHVAAGSDWLGRDVGRGPVLYIAAERYMVVVRRLAAWRIHHGYNDLPLAILSGTVDMRSSPSTADAVVAHAKAMFERFGDPVRLVVLDTMSRALAGGDENSSKDMMALVGNLSRIQEVTGAAVMGVHHIPQDGTPRLRGHGSLLGAIDTSIGVEAHATARTATVDKTNDAEEGEGVSFTLQSVTIAPDGTTAPVVVQAEAPKIEAGGPKLSKNQITMFTILKDAGPAGLPLAAWNDRCREAGIGEHRKADLTDNRNALKSKGLIMEGSKGWFTT